MPKPLLRDKIGMLVAMEISVSDVGNSTEEELTQSQWVCTILKDHNAADSNLAEAILRKGLLPNHSCEDIPIMTDIPYTFKVTYYVNEAEKNCNPRTIAIKLEKGEQSKLFWVLLYKLTPVDCG